MQKRKCTKTYLSIEEQLNLLKQRGLTIHDHEKAKHCLETVSYYRLSGYFKPFQRHHNDIHQFFQSVSFEQIWGVYVFDRELRLILLDVLERIEVALRSAMSNCLSNKYGNLWYLSTECFSQEWFDHDPKMRESQSDYFKYEVNRICRSQNEEFIKHYFDQYNQPPYPPSWMIMECLSFGKCISLFRYLKTRQDKTEISKVFGYHPKVIESCLGALRYVRNVCAHHARLWNRWFVFIPRHTKAFGNIETKSRSLHEQLVMIQKLHQKISPDSSWKERLYDLFVRYEEFVPYHLAGFQKDWVNDPFWDL